MSWRKVPLLLPLLALAGCQLVARFSSAPGAADGAMDASPDSEADAGPDGPLAPGTHIWSHRLGHAGGLGSIVVAADASGNVFAAGSFFGVVDFGDGDLTGAGAGDIFVASYDPLGDHRWSARFGDDGIDEASAIAVSSSGDVVVAGIFSGAVDFGGGPLTSTSDPDAFLVSFSGAGAHRWSRAFAGSGLGSPVSAAVDAAGAVAITGQFSGSIDFGGPQLTTKGLDDTDAFFARFTAEGAHRWSKGFGGDGSDSGLAVALAPGGALFGIVAIADSADFGGGALQSGGNGEALVRFEADGEHRWSGLLVGRFTHGGQAIAVGPAGNIFVTGGFESTADLSCFDGGTLITAGGQDILVASFAGEDGAHRWSKRFGGGDTDRGFAVAVDGNTVTVTGAFRETVNFGGDDLVSAGNADIFVASLAVDGGAHLRSRRFGAAGADRGTAVAVHGAGAVTIAGRIEEQVSFGGAPLPNLAGSDRFVVRLAPDGDCRWSRTLPGTSLDEATCLAAGPGGVGVGGTFHGTAEIGGADLTSAGNTDVFAARFAADGAPTWARAGGGSAADTIAGFATAPDGTIFITGRFLGTADLGGGALTSTGSGDVFVASFDAAGDHRWSRSFGGAGLDRGASIAITPGGAVVVTGRFAERIDFGGDELTSAGAHDIFLVSLGADGSHRWSKRFGGAGTDWGQQVAVAADGTFVLTGSFTSTLSFGSADLTSAGGYDGFLASFDADGSHRWSKRFGGPSTVVSNGVAVDAGGNVLVTGDFQGALDLGDAATSAGVSDVFIASFTADGDHRWSHAFGGKIDDHGLGVAADASGNVFVVGSFWQNVDFGGGALTSAGLQDMFVASFTADGDHRWSRAFGGRGLDRAPTVAVFGGAVFVAGSFTDRVDFGGGPIPGAHTGFVAAFVP